METCFQGRMRDVLLSDTTHCLNFSSLHSPPHHKNTCLFCSLLTALYTITTLESGGYEMEFPSRDFLTELQGLLRRVYPSSRWQVYSSRAVTKLYYDAGEAGTHDPPPTCGEGGTHDPLPVTQVARVWGSEENQEEPSAKPHDAGYWFSCPIPSPNYSMPQVGRVGGSRERQGTGSSPESHGLCSSRIAVVVELLFPQSSTMQVGGVRGWVKAMV